MASPVAQHLLFRMRVDPEITAYVGVVEDGRHCWLTIAYSFGESLTTLSGQTIPLRDDLQLLLVTRAGEVLEGIGVSEPLPAGVRSAEEVRLELEALIRAAFEAVPYPGTNNLRGSDEGAEPYRVEREFASITNWRALDAPEFLDAAPGGLGSALSFFSADAFRYYLPAYLIADIRGQLRAQDPAFQLTHGLTDATRNEAINPRRYGDQTWFVVSSSTFARFTCAESQAIVAYLRWKRGRDTLARTHIDQALQNYWLARTQSS